jgi:hypothetical protein
LLLLAPAGYKKKVKKAKESTPVYNTSIEGKDEEGDRGEDGGGPTDGRGKDGAQKTTEERVARTKAHSRRKIIGQMRSGTSFCNRNVEVRKIMAVRMQYSSTATTVAYSL